MSAAALPLPQYAFMAWCSVKAQEQLYLYIYFGQSILTVVSYKLPTNNFMLILSGLMVLFYAVFSG
jgi:hypothetical protein